MVGTVGADIFWIGLIDGDVDGDVDIDVDVENVSRMQKNAKLKGGLYRAGTLIIS